MNTSICFHGSSITRAMPFLEYRLLGNTHFHEISIAARMKQMEVYSWVYLKRYTFSVPSPARIGSKVTNSYLDRGASRKGGTKLQPYLAILAFQMIGKSFPLVFLIIITDNNTAFHQWVIKPFSPLDQGHTMRCSGIGNTIHRNPLLRLCCSLWYSTRIHG